MTPLSNLHSLTNRILDVPADGYGELFPACDELYQFLTGITSIDPGEASNREQLMLNSGKAIGLTWAAMCIKDLVRTKKFMDGAHNALNDALKKIPDRPVHILYAGTGPFASLVLPLMARFSPAQVQFSLLEVNERSHTCLQKLINDLDLGAYIRRIEKADASKWTINPSEQTDIFLSETMNLGLVKEPQVAIFMNMVPQLQTGTILIPEKINLEAALINAGKRMSYKLGTEDTDNSVYPLAPVFELSRETVLANTIAFNHSKGVYDFPRTTVRVPAGMNGNELSILTTVTIYSTLSLQVDESPLTLPLKLTTIIDPAPAAIHLWYHTGENPGVKAETG